MRFVTGPRQTGKTTIAKQFLKKCGCETLYYNWDNRKIRDSYLRDNHFFSNDIYNTKSLCEKRWLCMDEIHKYPDWKNVLKDFFDSFCDENGFIITGSARLDLFHKSGDSLAGRYFLFHLNPLTLREGIGVKKDLEPPNQLKNLFSTLWIITNTLKTKQINYWNSVDFQNLINQIVNGFVINGESIILIVS
jgi:predicted AAA+ superfamily ATPase